MIEMLFEYISFILCIHKIAKKKLKLDIWLIVPFLIEMLVILLNNRDKIPVWYKLIVFGGLFLYTKIKVVGTWNKAVSVYGIMLIVIMSLQLLQYYFLKFFMHKLIIREGIIVNINICLVILLWKEKYSKVIMAKINEVKWAVIAVIFLLTLSRILYLFTKNVRVDFEMAMQFLLETIGLSVASVLWIGAENEKNHKVRELQMYDMYNRTFEEAIIAIRTRQHEFENHINAIRCLQYSIADREEVLEAQREYCEKVIQENKLNKLLKLNFEPVLIGFLYSKITAAEEKGIDTKYEVQAVDIKEKVAIYEFIELVGILFDNAVEALEEKENKTIILKVMAEKGKSFSVEIANASAVYPNSEIEKFSSYGYSTKGEKRGVGLTRVKEITKKYNAVYHIQNCIYSGDNYLSFKITFD